MASRTIWLCEGESVRD